MKSKFKFKYSYYKEHTPITMRKVGDAILIAGPIFSGAVMNLPIKETTKLWINFGITCCIVIGKILTNFFAIPGEVSDKSENLSEEESETTSN